MKRLMLAVLAGCLIACAAAETLGEYALTGATPWLASLIVPALIGTAMTSIVGAASGYRRTLWAATGPLSAACLGWGVAISTSWGIDPVPAAAWGEIAIALAWPLAWAAVSGPRRISAAQEDPGPETPAGSQRTASSEIRPS